MCIILFQRGIADTNYRWPGYPGKGRIPYVIDGSIGKFRLGVSFTRKIIFFSIRLLNIVKKEYRKIFFFFTFKYQCSGIIIGPLFNNKNLVIK